MSDQMALLPPASPFQPAPAPEDEVSWELDDQTRQLGRRGLAAARQALRQASSRLAA